MQVTGSLLFLIMINNLSVSNDTVKFMDDRMLTIKRASDHLKVSLAVECGSTGTGMGTM